MVSDDIDNVKKGKVKNLFLTSTPTPMPNAAPPFWEDSLLRPISEDPLWAWGLSLACPTQDRVSFLSAPGALSLPGFKVALQIQFAVLFLGPFSGYPE